MRLAAHIAAVVAGALLPAAPALAGEPTMPLSQVHSGMRCTGLSVIHGTDISSFDVDVLDVVDGDPSENGPRILVSVSGPAVDSTGIGPGFSGSPIECRDDQGTQRIIGAISESVGEYGGKVALATPIEAILDTPVAPPSGANEGPGGRASVERRAAVGSPAWTGRSRGGRVIRGPALAEPLSVSGVAAPLARALVAAGRRVGRAVLAAPAGPLGSFPPQVLRPGSAVGVGYSSGDLRLGAIGTVTYVDGDRVWAFGHAFEDVGRRALLLQDAYVFRVVNNPLQSGDAATYKLAAPGHDLGTLSSDGDDAVAGTTGALPHTVPVRIFATDRSTGRSRTVGVRAADEAAVDYPDGVSPLTSVAPLAVAQAGERVVGSAPGRATGQMCAQIALQELKRPIRFCNRYVSADVTQVDEDTLGNSVTTGAASDLFVALTAIESYTGPPPHLTEVAMRLTEERGERQAFLDRVGLPRRVRRGGHAIARVTMQRVRGATVTRRYRIRIPAGLSRGRHTFHFVGTDIDGPDAGLASDILLGGDFEDTAGTRGPRTLHALAREIEKLARYDGVRLGTGGERTRAFRDPAIRISGRARTTVRVV